MDNLPFDWPVIGFGCAIGFHSLSAVSFHELDHFNRCSLLSLEHGSWVGMFLVDALGRSWEITSVRRRRPPSLGRRFVLFLARETLIEFDLAEREPVSLEQLVARVIEAIDAYPDHWRDDEAIAGESGPPRDEMEMLEEIKDRVRKAQSVAELIQFAELYPPP